MKFIKFNRKRTSLGATKISSKLPPLIPRDCPSLFKGTTIVRAFYGVSCLLFIRSCHYDICISCLGFRFVSEYPQCKRFPTWYLTTQCLHFWPRTHFASLLSFFFFLFPCLTLYTVPWPCRSTRCFYPPSIPISKKWFTSQLGIRGVRIICTWFLVSFRRFTRIIEKWNCSRFGLKIRSLLDSYFYYVY